LPTSLTASRLGDSVKHTGSQQGMPYRGGEPSMCRYGHDWWPSLAGTAPSERGSCVVSFVARVRRLGYLRVAQIGLEPASNRAKCAHHAGTTGIPLRARLFEVGTLKDRGNQAGRECIARPRRVHQLDRRCW
jgi:hypothetical protein